MWVLETTNIINNPLSVTGKGYKLKIAALLLTETCMQILIFLLCPNDIKGRMLTRPD